MAARLSDAWLDELRSRLNIVDVVSEYVPLKQKGRRYWGLCPFHNEKSASFSVDADAQMFYCFGCHKGGTAIHFVMELERMEFIDAVKLLAERARLELPRDQGGGSGASRTLKERVYEANQLAARFYHDAIWQSSGAHALAYLHKRGLDDADVRRFGLGATGASWDALTEHLIAKGFSEEELIQAGLTVSKNGRRYDMFRERVIFPIISAQNRVLGFGGRAMGDGTPKYLNTADTPVFNKRQGLYAMNMVRNERGLKRLVLVEGYMDVVSLRARGVEGVVATLGTALTSEQARLIKRYVPEVWVAYDGDGAGRQAILRALDIIAELGGIKARVLNFPNGQDPDDFVRERGLEGFHSLKPMDPIDYRMQRAADGLDLSTQEGRTEYAIVCCNLLKAVDSPVELDGYLDRLRVETGFEKDVLMRQVGAAVRQIPQSAAPRGAPRRVVAKLNEVDKAQHELLALLAGRMIEPSTVSERDFDDPLSRKLAGLLLSGIPPAAALDALPEEERAAAAQALSLEVMPDERNALDAAEECLKVIRRARMEDELERLTQEVALPGIAPERKMELLTKITELTKAKGMA